MDEKNPFDGIKTYDNYAHLWQLTAFILFLQIAVSVLVYFWERKSGIELNPFEGIIPAQAVTGYLSWAMLSGLGVTWRGAWADWNRSALSDVKKALRYFAGYLLVLSGMLAVLMAAWWVSGGGTEKLMEPLSRQNLEVDGMLQGVAAASRLRLLLVLFSACVAAPIAEEVFFRRIVFTTLRLRRGFWYSAFWSALLFSLFHGVAAPAILPVGLYLCWVYERERRLPANILLHSLINLTMVTLKVLT